MATGDVLVKSDACPPGLPYRETLGSLLYISRTVRPDIAHSVAYLAQLCASYDHTHFEAAKRIVRYLKGTSDMGLLLTRSGRRDFSVQIICDADWASNRVDRKSMSGGLTMVNGNIVNWTSKKQSTVALSLTEAEVYAMTVTVTDVLKI